MHIILLVLLIIAVVFGPQLWARWVLRRHSRPRPDFPGSGGEFARHLLKRLNIDGVEVETTTLGDHYDPQTRTVRLTEDKLNGKSLTAVVVAAHEVGHALQHHTGYTPLAWRSRLVGFASGAEKLGGILMLAVPVIALLTRAPAAGGLTLLLGALVMLSATLVHLVTLPVEFDASFRRALPALRSGEYLTEREMKAARHILTACAMTYVAQSLTGLLNIWRWLRVLRR